MKLIKVTTVRTTTETIEETFIIAWDEETPIEYILTTPECPQPVSESRTAKTSMIIGEGKDYNG